MRKKQFISIITRFILMMFCIISITAMAASSQTKGNENKKPVKVAEAKDDSFEFPIFVSIIQLLGNPDKYHSKKVLVTGVGNLEFESDILYISKEDYKYAISTNGISIIFNRKEFDYEKFIKLNGKYVSIVGTFNKNIEGHLGTNTGGGIEKIERYEDHEKFLEVNNIKREVKK